MVTGQQMENPLHNKQEMCTLCFREHPSCGKTPLPRYEGGILSLKAVTMPTNHFSLERGILFFCSILFIRLVLTTCTGWICTAYSHLLQMGLSCQQDPAWQGPDPCLESPAATDTLINHNFPSSNPQSQMVTSYPCIKANPCEAVGSTYYSITCSDSSG